MQNAIIWLFKCAFLINTFTVTIQAEGPLVVTPLGVVEGYWTKSVNNKEYAAFDGIPYASPPVGENRFEEPKPVKPWSGIWKANIEHKCLQYNHYTEPGEDFVIGSEDCLYLNLYTPKLNATKYFDVIIYIHGGAFMFNAASKYGHKYILDKDVVHISLNYRLGPLGFLSTEDDVLPGNNGLKDQIMALKWINANVHYFSGNPNSITLTGMSAGGASVHIHYMSPLTKGLFHRGIAQSGTALNAWVLTENSSRKAKQLGSIVGCNCEQSRLLVDCLKQKPGRQIVESVKHFLGWLYNPFTPFGVVVDRFSSNPVLPEHPYLLLKEGKFKKLPLIFSCVQSEGLYPAADFLREPEYLETIDRNWNEVMPYILDYNYTVSPSDKDNVSSQVRKSYFDDKNVSRKTFPNLVRMITHRLFISDIELAAKLHASASNSSTYFYHFSYRGTHSKSEARSRTNENFGASHGDDTVYVLSSNVNTRTTAADLKMTDILLSMWTSYAESGVPKLGNITWTPLNKDFRSHIEYAHIMSPDEIEMKTIESMGNRKFWHSLKFAENKNLFTKTEDV